MSTPLRVLFVEDSEDDMRLLVRQLRQGGYAPTFELAETADGLRAALHRGGWDLIISDYSMPRFSGLEALAVTLQLAPDVPFLLVSGTVGEEVAVESIKAGAADYLMKQNLIRFVPARGPGPAGRGRAAGHAAGRGRPPGAAIPARDDLRQHVRRPGPAHLGAAEAAWKLSSVNRATLLMARALGKEVAEADLLGRRLEEVARALWPADGLEADGVLEDFSRRPRPAGRGRGRPGSAGGDPVLAELTLIPFFGPDGHIPPPAGRGP